MNWDAMDSALVHYSNGLLKRVDVAAPAYHLILPLSPVVTSRLLATFDQSPQF